MSLISIGSWSSPGGALHCLLLVVSIPLHLIWVVENSHQCYGTILGLLIAMPDRLALDFLIPMAENLVAGVLVRTA